MLCGKFFTYGVCYLRILLGKNWAVLWSSVSSSWKLRVSFEQFLEALGKSWQLWTAPGQLWAPPGSSKAAPRCSGLLLTAQANVTVTYTESNPVEERKKCSKASRRNLPVLPLKARYRLWFLWTEFKLKLALGEMDLKGLWKHALQPLLLSVMCLLWCLLSFLIRWSLLCYTTCPLCFGFGTCSVYYIVAFVCSILFYISLLFYLHRFWHMFVMFITLLSLVFKSFFFQCLLLYLFGNKNQIQPLNSFF